MSSAVLWKRADERSDVELVHAVRDGDVAAFTALWGRHRTAGLRAARAVTGSIDPEDLVSEAFTKTLSAIRNGGGPTGAFRPYLFAAIRNAAATWGGRPKDIPLEFIDDLPDEDAADPVDELSDRTALVAAFRTLPENYRTLLWYLEVDGMKPRELVPVLGMSANSISALAVRAREAFRCAWLHAHISDPNRPEECRWVCERLVRRGRRPMPLRDHSRLTSHLATCDGCTLAARELDQVSQNLRTVLLPLSLGASAAGAYLALDGGTTASAAVALAGTEATGRWASVPALLGTSAAVIIAGVAVAAVTSSIASPAPTYPSGESATTRVAVPAPTSSSPPPPVLVSTPSPSEEVPPLTPSTEPETPDIASVTSPVGSAAIGVPAEQTLPDPTTSAGEPLDPLTVPVPELVAPDVQEDADGDDETDDASASFAGIPGSTVQPAVPITPRPAAVRRDREPPQAGLTTRAVP
ncbi:hypothetical protein MICRO8M_100024 [Microbacterium sp. 8M]|uniref:sigma factor n=1 Tax=Microbacterium sp. 8M TaxID=2653153 RepID=UPI0012EF8BD1|nr:sigma factor [Microbacterium sp. 8M]VXB00052.1 hypothetical protein MICRO8M_100024 [Microbacterium sp. 8M]